LADGRVVVEAELDSGPVARRLRRELGELYGQTARVRVLPAGGVHAGPRYLVWVERDGGVLARCTGLVDRAGRPVRGLPPRLSREVVVMLPRRGGGRSWPTGR